MAAGGRTVPIELVILGLPLPLQPMVRLIAGEASYKTQVRSVTQPKTSLLKKRKVIEQEGGFLGALLGLAVPLISSLISGLAKGG